MIKENKGCARGCGCVITLMLFNVVFGGFSFDYCLWNLLEKNVPWFADILCGLLLAEITVPAMVVIYILKMCGIEFPLT